MRIYFSLGANTGDRRANLNKAIDLLSERVGVFVACSSFYETVPMGFTSENRFLNCACCFEAPYSLPLETPSKTGSRVNNNECPDLSIIHYPLSIEKLLDITEEIERELGRTQKSAGGQHFDRPIDIDLLFADDMVFQSPRLTLPHPRLHERRFVLEPLAEIAPDFIHPLLKISVKDMLNNINTNEMNDKSDHTSCKQEEKSVCPAQIERLSEATPEAAEAIRHLLTQLSSTPRNFTLLHLTSLLQTPLTHLFVLRDETGKICAMATLCITHMPTGTKAWIEDLVVDSECRGCGYGRRLIEHLTTMAFAMKADAVMLTSRPSRIAANALYRSAGFQQKETNVYVKKK